jgi:hypothetical protein
MPIRRRRRPERKALLVGWFSLPFGGATAGDLAALEVVEGWLGEIGLPYDVALAEPFDGGLDWQGVEPGWYSHVLHVCGPAGPDLEIAAVLERFSSCRLIGVNVSLPEAWDPFDVALARDRAGEARADLSFAASREHVPVAGVLLVHPQVEYAEGRHEQVDRAAWDLVAGRPCAALPLDTRMDVNEVGLRSRAELEAVVSRLDVLVTTRLHGLVFALRSGVPALALDPIAGGAKVAAQAKAVGWPAVVTPEEATSERLEELWSWCLSPEARETAKECAQNAGESVARTRAELERELR